jgi:hypothetical protein
MRRPQIVGFIMARHIYRPADTGNENFKQDQVNAAEKPDIQQLQEKLSTEALCQTVTRVMNMA